MSQLFASAGQSIGASVSASVLPMKIQCWFPLGLTSSIICSPILYYVPLSVEEISGGNETVLCDYELTWVYVSV